MSKIIGVKKSNKKKTEFFCGVENGELKFSENPMESYVSSDEKAAKTIADILALGDKRNAYETFSINIG